MEIQYTVASFIPETDCVILAIDLKRFYMARVIVRVRVASGIRRSVRKLFDRDLFLLRDPAGCNRDRRASSCFSDDLEAVRNPAKLFDGADGFVVNRNIVDISGDQCAVRIYKLQTETDRKSVV